jgi:hypothetical protein
MIRTITLLTGLVLFTGLALSAQDVPDTVPARIVDGDTIALIDLKAFMAFPPFETSARKVVRYDRMVYNIKKVYPYAKLAAEKLAGFDKVLDTIRGDKERKAYIKKAEKELEDQFGPEIRDLTYSQGKILIKLIYRQTGTSSFEIVKELRGKFTAFVWQTLASIFGYDLKTVYDPVHDPQDQLIERIVLMIEEGAI